MSIDYNAIMKFAEEKIKHLERPVYDNFRSRYSHSLRVMQWGKRLQRIEGGNLEVIIIACILHDIGWDKFVNHALISSEIADKYLTEINYNETKKVKVLEAIKYHNMRAEQTELNLETYIVMDADILDEVGALSILWDAMSEAQEANPSYNSAYQRMLKYTQQIKDRASKLKTAAGKKFYKERIEFIDRYLQELEFELGLTDKA